nr:DUF4145 domain-containing protein [Nitrosomonas nitrosa]
MSQFIFLQHEWATVFEAASKAEVAVQADPRTACFYARRALELAVGWAYKHDATLKLPYQDNLSARSMSRASNRRQARRCSARRG